MGLFLLIYRAKPVHEMKRSGIECAWLIPVQILYFMYSFIWAAIFCSSSAATI